MSATDDVGRWLTLIPWLVDRQGASLAETAEAFGVSEATIRRDLEDHLDYCGLPGLGGGALFDVTIVEDRIMVRMADELRRPLRPTAAEAFRLVLTVDAVAEVLDDELPELRTAMAKVRAALGVSERVADVLDPGGNAATRTARQAVADGRRVRLRYQGRGDTAPREREVDPWAVRYVQGTWYLQGHDHGVDDARTFRLDRVVELESTEVPASVPAPDVLAVPRYQPGPDDLVVQLRMAPAARWLLDGVDVDEVTEHDDGTVDVVLRTDAPRHLARMVLMAGGAAEVVTPPELVTLVADLATAAAGRYDASD